MVFEIWKKTWMEKDKEVKDQASHRGCKSLPTKHMLKTEGERRAVVCVKRKVTNGK